MIQHPSQLRLMPIDDRRTDRRFTTVFRPIGISSGSFRGLSLVRNIGPGGLMCTLHAPLSPGSDVQMDFNGNIIVAGTIAWSDGGLMGVKFSEAVDVDELLYNIGLRTYDGKTQRAPRLDIPSEATLHVFNQVHRVQVADVSQRGVKIECRLLRVGDEVNIVIDGLDAHKATVRWIRNGHTGLVFLRQIGLVELAEWAVVQQFNCGQIEK